MNISQMQAEDESIELLKKENADLKRKVSQIEKRYREDVLYAREKSMYSVDEWCYRNSVSKFVFYRLQKEGRGPRLTSIKGTRRQFITADDDKEWLMTNSNFDRDKNFDNHQKPIDISDHQLTS